MLHMLYRRKIVTIEMRKQERDFVNRKPYQLTVRYEHVVCVYEHKRIYYIYNRYFAHKSCCCECVRPPCDADYFLDIWLGLIANASLYIYI